MRAMGFGGLYPGMVGMSRGRRKSVGSYTTDATSGIAIPQTTAEWSAFLSAKGLSTWSTPDNLYLCQDMSGGIVDSVGGISLAEAGTTHAYQQAVSGWSAKQATCGTSSGFRSTSTSLPDVSTTSQLILAFMVPPASVAANTDWLAFGGHSGVFAILSSTGKATIFSGATNAATTANVVTGRSWLPVVMQHDVAHSSDGLYTDVEKVVPTFHASTSSKGLYLSFLYYGTVVTEGTIYLAQWTGPKAERSQADIKALQMAMNLNPTWT